jgi:hypothetical protein
LATLIIPAVEAWKRATGSEKAHWKASVEAYAGSAFDVAYEPKFALDKSDRFFCIGSCFARNIEEHLNYRGVQVLSLGLAIPASEHGGRPNAILNKFTSHSMMNELQWASRAQAYNQSFFYQRTDGAWLDLHLSPSATAVTIERALQRRIDITRDYFAKVKHADVVIMTLGLNEVWRDNQTGLYLNAPPSPKSATQDEERYCLHVTSVEENVAAITAAIEAAMQLNSTLRFIVTVSPVPLIVSFSGQDAAIANANSKSVLRCAAEVVSTSFSNVDYFPSYEMVTLAPRALVYGEDCAHVSDDAVGRVVAKFLLAHGLPSEPLDPEFAELSYCAANPEVLEAVRRNEFASGFEHWQQRGRTEGRKLRPDQPTATMRLLRIQ